VGWLQALLAGAIQGATEFLPVSSSGHLVIFQTLSGESESSNLAFTVLLHLATLLSVLLVYRKDIWQLILEFFAAMCGVIKGKPDFQSPERRFLLMVIIGTIPAVVAGLSIKLLKLDEMLENIFVVGAMLMVTSILMFCVDRVGKGQYAEADAPFRSALLVGLLQSIAILPGLSRSGSTIFGGLLGGLKKEFAVKYAFILSIPVILGAGLVEMVDVVKGDQLAIDPLSWFVGFLAAMLTGIVTIRLIRVLIAKSKFYVFGFYCLAASLFAFLLGFGLV